MQLQGAWPADAGGDHGDADLLWAGLCEREGRGGHNVHLHASGTDNHIIIFFALLCIIILQ